MTSSEIESPEKYCAELVQFIADRRVTIEVCLTSNLQTMPELPAIKDHAFRRMVEERLSVTLCTDNRLISNTSMSKEIQLAVENFPVSAERLKHLIIYGFKRSFYPGTYIDKRKYVRRIIDFYEAKEREFDLSY